MTLGFCLTETRRVACGIQPFAVAGQPIERSA
jgi:hypothetical protein